MSYSDNVGHVLRTMSWGFDERAIVTDTRYDALGRVSEVDQPRFDSAAPVLNRRHIYDELNRVKRVETIGTGNRLLTTRTKYQGLTLVHTNPLGRKRVETRDALGQLREVVQKRSEDGGDVRTKFAYEVFGGLRRTEDPNANVITVNYDKLGRKTELQDPDLGKVGYDVDPLGQVWRSISPKQRASGQSTTFRFDLLGRMTARFEPDLESRWVYDQQPGAACAASRSCGQLVEAYTQAGSVKDYVRLHTFDALGRARTVSQIIGDGVANATFRSTTDYDAWSRPIRATHQRNADTAKVYDQRYNNTGFLARLERGALVLWQVREQDAANRPTQFVLGNGLTQNRAYDVYTDRLESATLNAAIGTPRLQEGYDYDAIGNVTLRTQFWDQGGFTETFKYDELNRLKQSDVGAQQQVFTYDDAGNMKSKTGGTAGTGGAVYVYPAQGSAAVRPHAVQQIDAGTYQYDVNGNMTSAPQGRSYTWTSFDMPLMMKKGTVHSSFVYGPEHQRTRQTRSDGSVEVYGGAQVTEKKGGVLTVKTYWPFGVGLETDVSGAPTVLNWVHADRLGSPVAISDQAGVLKEKLAYDAWGKRRSTDGTNLTPDSLDGVIDNRGFTGHEMLDQLDLVHMNGRVYDPSIGRFLTADLLISDPLDGQNYNRYAYVLNNPTNLTDPSGFSQEATADCNKKQTCPSNQMPGPDCAGDCAKDAQGKPIRYAKNADGDWELTVRTEPSAKSTNGQAKTDAKNSANSGSDWYRSKFKVEETAGYANDGTPVSVITDTWTKPKRYYGTPGEVMAGWIAFDVVTSVGRDMGASERQLFWLGIAGMVGNPKTILPRAVSKAPVRQLRASDLGIKGTVRELKGTFVINDGVATMRVDMIRGEIENPLQVVSNMVETAKAGGATSLRIEGTIANEKLYNVLSRRYGLASSGATDVITIPIR